MVGGSHLVPDGQRGDARLEAAGRAEQVPVIDLVDEIASFGGVLAEAPLDGERLEWVVDGRRGAVGVDVVDLVGPTPRLASAAASRARRRRRPRRAP
jgi:hypothetical protein